MVGRLWNAAESTDDYGDENLAAFVAELRTVTPSAGESLVTGNLRMVTPTVSLHLMR